MDDKSLVEALLHDSAQLELALDSSSDGFESRMVVARDSAENEWSLLVAIPPQFSRLEAYARIQDKLQELDLNLDLDRIVLIKNSDPGLKELMNNASVLMARAQAWNITPVEVSGRHYVDPIRVRLDPRIFERDVLRALSTAFPVSPSRSLPIRGVRLSANEVTYALHFDAQFVVGQTTVLIDAKANRRPLLLPQVLSTFGSFSMFQRLVGGHAVMALIASGGFSDRVESSFAPISDFALITWQPTLGDASLVRTIERLITVGTVEGTEL